MAMHFGEGGGGGRQREREGGAENFVIRSQATGEGAPLPLETVIVPFRGGRYITDLFRRLSCVEGWSWVAG